MTRIETSIIINTPPEKVWEMLALDRHEEWDEEMQKDCVKYTSEVHTPEDKYKAGASAHVNIKGKGEFDFEITESLENEKMTFHVKQSNQTTGIMTFILEPVDEGTKFTNIFDYEMPWGVFGKFLERLFARRMEEKHLEKCLGQLKSILEE